MGAFSCRTGVSSTHLEHGKPMHRQNSGSQLTQQHQGPSYARPLEHAPCFATGTWPLESCFAPPRRLVAVDHAMIQIMAVRDLEAIYCRMQGWSRRRNVRACAARCCASLEARLAIKPPTTPPGGGLPLPIAPPIMPPGGGLSNK